MKATIVGKAVALARGHYRQANGVIVRIREGEVFNLVEGFEKATWFKRLPDEPAAAPVVEQAPEQPAAPVVEQAPEQPAAPARRGRPPKAEQAGDIV